MNPAPLRRLAALPALALLLAAGPAPAQPPESAPAAAAEAEAPADPAESEPDAADLSAGPRPALPADVANLVLAPDFRRLPIGGWRLGGRAGRGEPDHGGRLAIETIGRYLAQQSTGRVVVMAQAAGPADDPSLARRATLARAITVKASLVRGGLPGTRIDLRPMGRLPEGLDAIDIIAPPAPQPRAASAAPPASPPPAAEAAPPRTGGGANPARRGG